MLITLCSWALVFLPALAHIGVNPPNAAPNSYATVLLKVGHGCDGSPTTSVTVTVPRNTSSVHAKYNPGWTISTTTRKLEVPMVSDGKTIDTTVDTITWQWAGQGGAVNGTAAPGLSDSLYDEFGVSFKSPVLPLTDGSKGNKIYFKTVQKCVVGATNWVEIPEDGKPEPRYPAPALSLAAPESQAAESSGSAYRSAVGTAAAAAVFIMFLI